MKNNYFKNVNKYINSDKGFFEGEWSLFEKSFRKTISSRNKEKAALDWLKEVAAYHTSKETGSRYWIEKAEKENITKEKIYAANDVNELLNLLGNSDSNLLKQDNGYNEFYKPKKFSLDKLFKSSSSGTTGPAKTIYHSLQSLTLSAVNEYTGIKAQYDTNKLKGKKLVASGPVGAYQIEHKKLAELLDMEYINNEFETKGLKLLSQQDLMKALNEIMSKTLNYLKEENVGLTTASMEIIPAIPNGLLKNVDVIKISGTQINYNSLLDLKTKGINAVPMYGHYAGKSSIGFAENGKINYFPAFPLTQYLMTAGEGRKRIKLIVAQPELFIVNDEDYASNANANSYFKPLKGISNPGRD
ncbi:MAG: hypothetical protein QXL94_05025 [Candidatus Parvarchaeum sp.]